MFPGAFSAFRQTVGSRDAIIVVMNIALTTSHDRMAPCFAGVELRILSADAEIGNAGLVSTRGWHPLAWGHELMHRDVGVLICASLNLQTWAGIRGHGIQVIPEAIGDPDTVLKAWQCHQLTPPRVWPMYGSSLGGTGYGAGRRHRFRGGRHK